MKTSKKLARLHDSAGTYDICRCYFSYDKRYWYFYIMDYSDKLMLGIEEMNFILDGYQIRKISQLKKIEVKLDLCDRINRENRILDGVKMPDVDITSWGTVFHSLKKHGRFIIVENEKDEDGRFFYLGVIKKVKKSSVIISPVDADGKWFDDVKLRYSDITSVTFGDRYSSAFEKYLSSSK